MTETPTVPAVLTVPEAAASIAARSSSAWRWLRRTPWRADASSRSSCAAGWCRRGGSAKGRARANSVADVCIELLCARA